MMADRCHPAEKIPYAAPPEPNISWHGLVLCDDLGKFIMYVYTPINVIPIGRIREFGMESKLQMIMRVDETGHDKKLAEINLSAPFHSGHARGSAYNMSHATADDPYG